MSYFLLKSRRHKPHAPSVVPGLQQGRNFHHNSTPRVGGTKPATAALAVLTGDGQMQLQQQVQRPKVNVMRSRQEHQQQQRSQHKLKQEQEQGVISMEEVMQDLRVLEQQQLDSQRKLATIKLTKQHRVEQQVSLENKLASVKYSNGEHRAQLIRSRDFLSKSTRELGKARLYGGRCSDDLKAFDRRLKNALALARRLRGMRRIVDKSILRLHMKESTLQQVKAGAKDNTQNAEIKRDEAQHREQLIRKSIQNHTIEAKQLEQYTNKMRSEVLGLEQDLTTAQQMETSTKLRAESISAEILTETSRNRRLLIQLEKKLDGRCEEKCNVLSQTEALKDRAEVLEKARVQSWQRGVKYAEEEGHETPDAMKDNRPIPFLDITRMRLALQQDIHSLTKEEKKNLSLQASINQSAVKETELVAREQNVRGQAESLKMSTLENIEIQEQRLQEMKNFLTCLKKDREQVYQLRESRSELEVSLRDLDTRASRSLHEKTQLYQEKHSLLSKVKCGLSEKVKDNDEAAKTWAQQQIKDKNTVIAAKEKAEAAKSQFEQIRVEFENMSSELHAKILGAVKDLQLFGIDFSDRKREAIVMLKNKYEFLSDLKVCTDSKMSREEQRQKALTDIQAACESSVGEAKKKREKMLQALIRKRGERNSFARETALERERQEDRRRRKRLEHEKAKRLREEESRMPYADLTLDKAMSTKVQKETDCEPKTSINKKRNFDQKGSADNEHMARKGAKERKLRNTTKRRHSELDSLSEPTDTGDAASYTKRAYGNRRDKSRKTILRAESPKANRQNASPRSSSSHEAIRFDSTLEIGSSYATIEKEAGKRSFSFSQARRVRWEGLENIENIENHRNGVVQPDIELGSHEENKIEEFDNLDDNMSDSEMGCEMVAFAQPVFPLSQIDKETMDDTVEIQDLEPTLKKCSFSSKDMKHTKTVRGDAFHGSNRLDSTRDHCRKSLSKKKSYGGQQQKSLRYTKPAKAKARGGNGQSLTMSNESVPEIPAMKSSDPKLTSSAKKVRRGEISGRDMVSKHVGKLKKSTHKKQSSSQTSGISSMERSSKMSGSALTKVGKSRRRKKGCNKGKAPSAGVGDDYTFHF